MNTNTKHTLQAWAAVILAAYFTHQKAPHLFTLALFWLVGIALYKAGARFVWIVAARAERKQKANTDELKQARILNVTPDKFQSAIEALPEDNRATVMHRMKRGTWMN